MNKKSSQKLVTKVVSKKTLQQNEEALKAYEFYRETIDIVERADIALGRKPAYTSETGSTINFKINKHDISSTTAQKV